MPKGQRSKRMVYKTTKSEVYYFYGKNRVLSVPYCSIQTLLSKSSRNAYTCGVYGWNADVYNLARCAIVTGYRPFGKSVSYELCKEYDKKAEKILYSDKRYKKYESKKNRLSVLLEEFCDKALAE